jgi:hypothetical protein
MEGRSRLETRIALCTRLCRYSFTKRTCRRVQLGRKCLHGCVTLEEFTDRCALKVFLLLRWRSSFFSHSISFVLSIRRPQDISDEASQERSMEFPRNSSRWLFLFIWKQSRYWKWSFHFQILLSRIILYRCYANSKVQACLWFCWPYLSTIDTF